MSVFLDERVLHRTLYTEHGLVGSYIGRKAERCAALAFDNASGALIGYITENLRQRINTEFFQNEGEAAQIVFTDATAGNRPGIRVDRMTNLDFSYPAWHDQNGRPWLTTALRDVMS
jgi:hypothetical protein